MQSIGICVVRLSSFLHIVQRRGSCGAGNEDQCASGIGNARQTSTPAPVTDLLRPQFATTHLDVDALAALKALHLDVPLPPALLVAESSVLKDDLVALRHVHLGPD